MTRGRGGGGRGPCSRPRPPPPPPPPPSPFTGQGRPPRGVDTPVYMSMYVDRIIFIDEKRYT
jgi:hypothetical protein